MNLVIDIGNSRTKFSVFNLGEEVTTQSIDVFDRESVDRLLKDYPSVNRAILSSVKDFSTDIKKHLKEKFEQFIELDHLTPLPFRNCYQTKETLGKDRLAAVAGAFTLCPGANVLVIDAGTAITYDLINSNGDYLGGNISPGLEMRFKALHQFTSRLPLIEKSDFNSLFGKTTCEAIRAGVQNGIVYEVDSTIESFKVFYKNITVIITGGDADFFDKKLKNSFFVHFNLIPIGLNRILEHNGEI